MVLPRARGCGSVPYDRRSRMPYLEVVLGLVVLELNVQAIFDADLHLGVATCIGTVRIERREVKARIGRYGEANEGLWLSFAPAVCVWPL